MHWTKCIERLPKPMAKMLVTNGEWIEVAFYSLGAADEEQQPGHDAGWIGETAFPSRTFGNPDCFYPAVCQPTHWMPLPEMPKFEIE